MKPAEEKVLVGHARVTVLFETRSIVRADAPDTPREQPDDVEYDNASQYLNQKCDNCKMCRYVPNAVPLHIGGNAVVTFSTHLESCMGQCVFEHEQVHVQQCEGTPWASGNPYFDANEAGGKDTPEGEYILATRTEVPAYGAAIACYQRMLATAAAQIAASGGSRAKACGCCRLNLPAPAY